MERYLLEACVDSVESAIAAAKGGADRLELCSNLVIGGTTPGVSQFCQIKKAVNIPIHVLIRPRYGDFLYSDYEFRMLVEDTKLFLEKGADGIVTGCLTPEGNLDGKRMEQLRTAVGDRHLTLHRAFDVCADPYKTLEDAVNLGVDTILTSGQQDTCMLGEKLLGELICQADERVDLLVGSGVGPEVIRHLIASIHARNFHMSGKVVLDSGMTYRKAGVNMGIPGIGEYEIFRTDEARIRQAKRIMNQASGLA